MDVHKVKRPVELMWIHVLKLFSWVKSALFLVSRSPFLDELVLRQKLIIVSTKMKVPPFLLWNEESTFDNNKPPEAAAKTRGLLLRVAESGI